MTTKYFTSIMIFSVILFLCSSCSSLAALDSAEKEYQQSVSKKILIHMDLETMFPDKNLRRLARAAAKGDLAQIERLVSQGVDVNSKGRGGATVLFWAMKNKDGFEYLLRLGADPNVIYDDGGTVMHWAARKDCSMLEIALKNGGDPNLKAGVFERSPIFETISVGKNSGVSACTKILLDYGADINSKDDIGKTPLLSAAKLGRYDIVYYLLEMGADYAVAYGDNLTIHDVIESHKNAFILGSSSDENLKKVKDWLEINNKIKGVENKRGR